MSAVWPPGQGRSGSVVTTRAHRVPMTPYPCGGQGARIRRRLLGEWEGNLSRYLRGSGIRRVDRGVELAHPLAAAPHGDHRRERTARLASVRLLAKTAGGVFRRGLGRRSSGNWSCPFPTELVYFLKSRNSATTRNLDSAKLVTPCNRDQSLVSRSNGRSMCCAGQ